MITFFLNLLQLFTLYLFVYVKLLWAVKNRIGKAQYSKHF